MTEFNLQMEDANIQGISISDPTLRLSNIWTGTLNAAGELRFPQGQPTANGQLVAHDKVGADAFTASTDLLGSYNSSTGAFVLGGKFAGEDGEVEFHVAGSSSGQRAPRVAVSAPSTAACNPATGTAAVTPSAAASVDYDGSAYDTYWTQNQGNIIAHGVSPAVQLAIGSHSLLAVVYDQTQLVGYRPFKVMANDEIPSLIAPPAKALIEVRNSNTNHVVFPAPVVTDRCSTPIVSGRIVTVGGRPVTPINLVNDAADVGCFPETGAVVSGVAGTREASFRLLLPRPRGRRLG